MLRNNRERGHLPEAAHRLNVNALKGQPAHSPGQHPGSHGFIPRFIALKGQKRYMNARYYAYAPTGRALTPLCQFTQGVATLCPGLWAVALSGRAFDLRDVHSTCKAWILPDYDLKYYNL